MSSPQIVRRNSVDLHSPNISGEIFRPPLRLFQSQALHFLKKPGHLICVSPTGSGKSRIYEEIALQRGRRTLLITPLVALARQQAQKLRALGIRVHLSAGDPTAAKNFPFSTRQSGIWIASPEQVTHPSHETHIENWQPDFMVVDECHCLWDWGDRFRPSFRKLPAIAAKPSVKRSLWLTATLPQSARNELRSQLPQPLHELGQFALPGNLFLEIKRAEWNVRMESLLAWVAQQTGAGIIFAPTRESTHRIMRVLKSFNSRYETRAAVYHAGLSSEERRIIEEKVSRNELDILIATSAFGMGMDYPHLRWTVLWQTPPTLLQLAQSLGRVGRHPEDTARALVLWSPEDFKMFQWASGGSPRLEEELQSTVHFLQSAGCRLRAFQTYFSQEHSNETSVRFTSKAAGFQSLRPVAFHRKKLCGQCDFCLRLDS